MTADPPTHLVIAGVTRAATTSLFTYLADHPHVCRSTIKETRFFLDEDYPLPRMHSFHEGIDAYDTFFPRVKAGQVKLEATPDYLYCAAAADRIAKELPGARIVFLLREPVARLVSWYRYAKQNGRLASGMSFDDYVAQQDEHGEQPMRALLQGRYSRYLGHWLDVFGSDHILVTTHEALRADARVVVAEVCRFCGLEDACYDGYEFRIINPSRPSRFPALERMKFRLNWAIKPHVHDMPAVRSFFRGWRRVVDRTLGGVNRADNEPVTMSDATRNRLEAFYADEPRELARLLGVDEWSWTAPPALREGAPL